MSPECCEECGVELNENTSVLLSDILCRWCIENEDDDDDDEDEEDSEEIEEDVLDPLILEENESIEANYYYHIDNE